MKILDLDATRSALPFKQLVDAIDAGFKGSYEAPLRHQHSLHNKEEDNDVLLIMPAWRDEGYGGIKLVNVVPGNSKRGQAALSSSYVLFDRTTGTHLLILDGGELTARRTAAASALAAKRLARNNSETHLIIGAGRVGQNLPFAYREVLPIKNTLVYDINIKNSKRMVSSLMNNGIEASVVENVENGVTEADVISCATLATSPVLRGEWLKPGQHIDLIGSFTPAMREADDLAIESASVYIDTKDALKESGDLITPAENGTLNPSDILGTLIDLCRDDQYPRRDTSEITLFKAVGTAIEDLSAAMLALAISENR